MIEEKAVRKGEREGGKHDTDRKKERDGGRGRESDRQRGAESKTGKERERVEAQRETEKKEVIILKMNNQA